MANRIRAELSKINFALGRNPRLLKFSKGDFSSFIPSPYRAVLLISADLELAWAWRYAKNSMNPYDEAILNARRARENIPAILNLCETHRIPITWATVGHLLMQRCTKDNHFVHHDLPRVPYHENDYWKYDRGDWFDHDPCSDWKKSPEWYAPDIIEMIVASDIDHEIACHTFSHIDCTNEICSPNILKHEIRECQKSAAAYGIKMTAFVHPGHTVGNHRTLFKLGFKVFRADYNNTLGLPRRHNSGLWELENTMEFVYRKQWSLDYHVFRYTEIINRAMSSRRVCLFWFHPSVESVFVAGILPRIFSYIDDKRNLVWVTTMGNYAGWLNRNTYGL